MLWGELEEAYQVLIEACSLAEVSNSNLHLWGILGDLAQVNSKLGNHKEAEDNLEQARKIVVGIAESLQEVGLRESFLKQPRVQALMR